MTTMLPPAGAKNVRLGPGLVTGPRDVPDRDVASLEARGWTKLDKPTTKPKPKSKAKTLKGDQDDGC